MKFKAVQYLVLVSVVLFSQTSFAGSYGTAAFLQNVQQLVRSCVVRPYRIENGKKVYGFLKSNCVQVRTFGKAAEFALGKTPFIAILEESPDADGGDLDNIVIKNALGTPVASLTNVLAFGDILLGLAGADVELPELYDQTASE